MIYVYNALILSKVLLAPFLSSVNSATVASNWFNFCICLLVLFYCLSVVTIELLSYQGIFCSYPMDITEQTIIGKNE